MKVLPVGDLEKRLVEEVIGEGERLMLVGGFRRARNVAFAIGNFDPTEPSRFHIICPFEKIDCPVFEGSAL